MPFTMMLAGIVGVKTTLNQILQRTKSFAKLALFLKSMEKNTKLSAHRDKWGPASEALVNNTSRPLPSTMTLVLQQKLKMLIKKLKPC